MLGSVHHEQEGTIVLTLVIAHLLCLNGVACLPSDLVAPIKFSSVSLWAYDCSATGAAFMARDPWQRFPPRHMFAFAHCTEYRFSQLFMMPGAYDAGRMPVGAHELYYIMAPTPHGWNWEH